LSIFPASDIEELKKLNLSFEVTEELVKMIRKMHYEEGLSELEINSTLKFNTGEKEFILKVLGYPNWDVYKSNHSLLMQKVQLGTLISTMQESLQKVLNNELLPGLAEQLDKISENLQNLLKRIEEIEKGLEAFGVNMEDDFLSKNLKKLTGLFKKEE